MKKILYIVAILQLISNSLNNSENQQTDSIILDEDIVSNYKFLDNNNNNKQYENNQYYTKKNSYKDNFIYTNNFPKITVGKINSSSTQLPYQFYEIGYCKRQNTDIEYKRDTIGELFTGDYYADSPFDIEITEKPKKACQMRLQYHDIFFLQYCIDKKYSISLFIDKLPIGYKLDQDSKPSYKTGIPIGFKDNSGKYYIYNYFKFTILYNDEESTIDIRQNNHGIVAGNVLPLGYNDNSLDPNYIELKSLDDYNILRDTYDENNENSENYVMEFGLYYSVSYEKTNIKYSSRWDFLLHSNEDLIHWKQIILSASLISLSSIWLLCMFLRSVNNEILNYNLKIIEGDLNPVDKGWKQLSYDIFRQPKNRTLLCAMIGSGVQIFMMISFTLVLGYIGFLSPENRGYLINTLIVSSIIFNSFNGYYSTIFYRVMNGQNWLLNLIMSSFFFPSILGITAIFNIIGFKFEGALAAPGEILPFLFLYFAISIPFILLGSSVAMMQKPIKLPCQVHQVPNLMPNQPWYLSKKILYIFTGIIPFSAFIVELFYLMASIWRHYYYNLFGFMFISLIILCLLSSLITIIVIHHQLNKGNYHWWWKSFFIAGSNVIYFVLFSIYYFFSLNLTRVSSILIYFSTMSLFGSIIFIICGSIGFISTFYYIKMIYSKIKID